MATTATLTADRVPSVPEGETEAEPLLVHSTEILSRGGGALELESRQSQQRLDHLYTVWRKK